MVALASLASWSCGDVASSEYSNLAASEAALVPFAGINFQPAASPVPAGYLADTGAPFAARGNGLTYGFSGDASATTRDRGLAADQRYDTLIHTQLYGSFTWEIAVPSGFYEVHVVAGDPAAQDSIYRFDVEGVRVIDGTPTSEARWVEGTQFVSVSDGRLTLTNVEGSSNNKLCFVDISTVDATTPAPPAAPRITEPSVDGQIVHPADVHMETAPFSDPNADAHACTDWEIRRASNDERVWSALCSTELLHIHLGDGTFEGSHSGSTELLYDTGYRLRVRHRDDSGDPAAEWSRWAERGFRTATPPPPGTSVPWTLRQQGFVIELFATGFQLPVNIAFIPNAGTGPQDPYLYVTELYGTIKVVARDGTVSDYVRGVLNYRPSGVFPGSGEQGLTGIVVDPISGDVFASMLYESFPGGPHYPKVVRFHSNHDGSVAGSSTTILDMPGESQGQSHQISNLSFGPDGKLYVHMGDGFETATAQNLASFRGKILRVNLDGTAPADNPFYDASDGITARDYVFAYGFRNPFGGDWRAADGLHYEVENGPSVDRFAKVRAGTNYGWNGSDESMYIGALFNWSPAVSPVNLAFVQSSTFGGSGLPATKLGHAFVSESGPTYASGPVSNGKRIREFVLNADGSLASSPTTLLDYTGTGKATVAGLAAGPDGLYFTDLYEDSGTTPTEVGANVLRIRWVGSSPNQPPSVSLVSPSVGASFAAPATIPLVASATDPDGSIARVDFYQGSTKIGEDTTPDGSGQYSFTWSGVPTGSYVLSARAFDDLGASTTSSAVNVTVTAPPAPQGDFAISASPSKRNVRAGDIASYGITVTPSGGLVGEVSFSAAITPALAGSAWSFTPSAVTLTDASAQASTLQVATSPSSPRGSFTVTITASHTRTDGASLTRTTTVQLRIRG